MNNDPKLPHKRRSIRLQGFDYSQDGAYFITICTHRKLHSFGVVIDGQMRLSDIGQFADKYWREIPDHFSHAELLEWVVMPNHVHGVIVLQRDDNFNRGTSVPRKKGTSVPREEGTSVPCPYGKMQAFGKPVKGSIPLIVGLYKSTVTKAVYRSCPLREKVWQRRYYEHVVRNCDDLVAINDYIRLNPGNWEIDKENLIPRQFPQILKGC